MEQSILLIIIIIFILSLCFKNVEGLTSGPVEKVCGCDDKDPSVVISVEEYDDEGNPIYPPQHERVCISNNNKCDEDALDKCKKLADHKLNTWPCTVAANFEECLRDNDLERERCNEVHCPLGASERKCSNFTVPGTCPDDRSKGQPCSFFCPESHPMEGPDNKCYQECAKPSLLDGEGCGKGSSNELFSATDHDGINNAKNKCESKTYPVSIHQNRLGNILNCKANVFDKSHGSDVFTNHIVVSCDSNTYAGVTPDCMFKKR